MIDLSNREAHVDQSNCIDDDDDIDDVERYSRSHSYTSRTSRVYPYDDSDDYSDKDFKYYFDCDDVVESDSNNTIEYEGSDGVELTK